MADKQFNAFQKDAITYLQSLGYSGGDAIRIIEASPDSANGQINWQLALSYYPDIDFSALRTLMQCPKCKGKGREGRKKCSDCLGRGCIGSLRYSLQNMPKGK